MKTHRFPIGQYCQQTCLAHTIRAKERTELFCILFCAISAFFLREACTEGLCLLWTQQREVISECEVNVVDRTGQGAVWFGGHATGCLPGA